MAWGRDCEIDTQDWLRSGYKVWECGGGFEINVRSQKGRVSEVAGLRRAPEGEEFVKKL